jgi:hypothetical protein
MNEQLKIAVCIVGFVRSFDKESFMRFIDNLPTIPDVFITTWDWKYHNIPIDDERNGYVNMSTFNGINIKDILIKTWKPELSVLRNANSSVPQNTNIVATFDMKCAYEKAHDFKYDIVYKTRFDVQYIDTVFDIPMGYEDHLIVPDLTNWNGNFQWKDYPQDCFYYASSINLDKVHQLHKSDIKEGGHYILKECGLPVYPHPGKFYLPDAKNLNRLPEDYLNL